MRNLKPVLFLGALLLLVAGAAAWFLFYSRPAAPPPSPTRSSKPPALQSDSDPEPVARALARATAGELRAHAAPSSDVVSGTTNWLQQFLANKVNNEPLPREQIERWLELNRSNVESLLAARQAGAGKEYLLQALTNRPNDPRVLFAALSLQDSPEAKRERLNRFKAAAPDNALPDYLSAANHFKNSRPEEGLRELTAAPQKSHFQDYMVDAIQNCEELYLANGKSPAEAKALSCSSALLPHLSQLKALAVDMAALQRQYLAAGDTASAANLAQYGAQLGRHLGTGEGSRALIDQMVGIAVERIVLGPLDPETHYDFLEGTPGDRLAQLDAQKAALQDRARLAAHWMPTASEADVANYFERFKLYGESSALAWLEQRRSEK